MNALPKTWPRADDGLIVRHGKEMVFLMGGNSSCHYHACQHYDLYYQWCKEATYWKITGQFLTNLKRNGGVKEWKDSNSCSANNSQYHKPSSK